MRKYGIAILAVFLMGALALMNPTGSVHADAPQAATSLAVSTTAQVDPQGHPVKGQYLITAVLTANGQPVNGENVAFFEQMQVMGSLRQVTLGTATTDSTGTAVVVYQPAQAGSHTLVAQFAGDSQYASTTGQSTMQVQAADLVPLFPTQPAPLGSVRYWLTVVVGTIVLLFWIFLIWLFLRTVLVIRLAPKHQVAEVHAKRAGAR